MPIAVFTHASCLKHDPGRDHPETPARLRAVLDRLGREKVATLRESAEPSGITVRELTERFHVPEDAVVAFVQTASELMGETPLDADTARRAALVAVAGQVWEHELGPSLSSSQVRELLGGVSRQRVDELLKSRRLIGLHESGGRWRFPAFQFVDGQPLDALVSAFWTVAGGAVSDWTAASWCVAPDDALPICLRGVAC